MVQMGQKVSEIPFKPIKSWASWMLVAHAYNPSYSGGRDQEDRGLKLDLILKIPITKKGWWSGLR
jgi:hypothetical protein